MPPIRRKIIDVDCLSEDSPYKPKIKEESDDDGQEVRVQDGVDEVEGDVEPQDDYNRLSDSDESNFAQDVADGSETLEIDVKMMKKILKKPPRVVVVTRTKLSH